MNENRTVGGPCADHRIALAPFLDSCPQVVTLGVRPCVDDYSEHEMELLRTARRVFFPTRRYVDVFRAAQIATFPCPTTYSYQRSRILQQLLFDYLECPHPRSRIFYGRKQKEGILDHFKLPVLVMSAQNTPGTIHIVRHEHELTPVANLQHAAIVCELMPWTEYLQLICVQFECIGALRQEAGRGGAAAAQPVPLNSAVLTTPLGITTELLRAARLDDILIEWGYAQGEWQLLGMARPPVRWPAAQGMMNRHRYICELIQAGVL